MTVFLAALAGAGAVLACWPPPTGSGAASWSSSVRTPGIVVVGSVLVLASGPSMVLVLGVLGLVVVRAVGFGLRRRHGALAAARRSDSVLEICDGLAADLGAGIAPVAALAAAAREWSEFAPVADAARLDADVPSALRALAGQPGAEQLRTVAAAWVVAHRTGAGLAGAIGSASRSIREDRATARIIATELASARATARMLAVLPFGVLLLGRGAGADPFGFLVGTTPGLVCLAVGGALSWCGLLWMQHIGDAVRRT